MSVERVLNLSEWLEDYQLGKFIGYKYHNIKAIEKKRKVLLSIQNNLQLKITGSPKAVDLARIDVELHALSVLNQSSRHSFEIPAEMVGYIIGRNGQKINAIKNHSGASINFFEGQTEKFCKVVVSGEFPVILSAVGMIKDRLDSFRHYVTPYSRVDRKEFYESWDEVIYEEEANRDYSEYHSSIGMETYTHTPTVGLIACCECGIPIQPNAANMCSGCLRSKVDITEGITRTCTIYKCKFCDRFFVPPNGWMRAEPESKELLSICLKKLKPCLLKVRLTDAAFVWTEAHSKRIKVKLTVQKEVFTNTILQQSLVVEFSVHSQMCDDCRRAEAKDFWRACVQVRQKAEFKKTLFYLEQLLLKHGAQKQCTGVKPVPTGIDFFFAKLQEARKLVDFLQTVLPCKYHYAQELVSHDTKNNTYDYKHTFCVEIVPICKDNIVVMPPKVAQSLGNMSQIAICLRISNVITLIDPSNLQMADVQATTFWRDPFEALCGPKQLSQFYILDVEPVESPQTKAGHGYVSKRHVLADVWLVRSDQVGVSDAQTFSTRTHMGHVLHPGDTVLALDVHNFNGNSRVLDEMKPENIPDLIIVKKVRDRTRRAQRRQWKLKRLVIDGNIVGNETASVADEFLGFMEDLEEDPLMREKVNIYRDTEKMAQMRQTMEGDDEEQVLNEPTLEEMLEDFNLNDPEQEDPDDTEEPREEMEE